jgi:oligogalacturonide transport system substrate-binding protein
MRKLRKWIGVICLIAMLLMVFSGCKPTESGTDTGVTSGSSETPTEAPKTVSLRFSWWGGDARHQATLEAIQLYMDRNPHVTIEAEYGGYADYYQKMVTQLAGEAAPDVMQVDSIWIADLYKQGEMFVDLYTMEDQIDMSGFDRTFLKNYCEVEGKLQGLPKSIATATFIYNVDFFERFGIDPETKLDWDNLLEIGTRIHQEDPECYLIQPHFGMMRLLILSYMKQKTGSNLANSDYTLGYDKELITEAFSYFRTLIDNGVVVPFDDTGTISEADEHPIWQNGKSGIIFNFDSTIPKIMGNSTFDLGVMLPPVMPGCEDTGITVKPGVLTSINKKTGNLKESAKFMDFYNNDADALIILGDTRGVPPTQAAMDVLVGADKLNPLLADAVAKGTENAGSPVNDISNNAEIDKITLDLFTEMAFKVKTPEAAAEELVSKLEEKLNELRN